MPSGPNLATAVLGVPAGTSGAWFRFSFAASAIVTPGHVYAIVILPTDNVSIWGSKGDYYARGRALAFSGGSWVTVQSLFGTRAPADWAFRTLVGAAPPTPTPTRAPTHAPVATAPPATAASTLAPTATPTATASATPTATPSPTDSPTATVVPATPTAPSGSGSGSSSDSSGSTDLTIPILAALILVLVLLAGGVGLLLGRRRQTGG